jgi:PEP-CTERM motif
LSFGALPTSGNRVTTQSLQSIGGLTRGLSTPLGTPGMTAYLSVEFRPEGTLNAGAFNGFFGLYLNGSLGTDMFVGKPGGGAISNYVLEDRGGTNQHPTSFMPIVGATDWLVVRADFTAGIDKFTLYVDPTPGGSEPLSGTVKQDSDVGTVSAITLYSTGAFSADEIRIGTTYADVTSTPEPGSVALMGIAGLLACGRRAGRR